MRPMSFIAMYLQIIYPLSDPDLDQSVGGTLQAPLQGPSLEAIERAKEITKEKEPRL